MPSSSKLKRIVLSVAAFAMAATLAASIALSWREVGNLPDLATGCDLFGHLQNAKAIREARATGETPAFDFKNDRERLLVDFLKTQPDAPRTWQYLPSPHAFSYRVASDKVINQYPPGTAYWLALFGENGISGVIRTTLLFAAALWLALVVAARARLDLASLAAITLLCEQIVFSMRELGLGNPSADATILPVILGSLLFGASIRMPVKATRAALLASAAGVCLGYAILIRPPNALLVLPLLFMIRGRDRWLFAAGAFLCGILPLALYQAAYAGAWYRSTYGEMDTGLPVLRTIPGYLRFYLKNQDEGGRFFLHGFALVLLCAGIARRRLFPWMWVWIPSLAFFVTHAIPTPYYMMPAHFALGTLLVIAILFDPPLPASKPRWIAGVLAVATIGTIAWNLARDLRGEWQPRALAAETEKFSPDRIPKELLDPRAWIWSDLYSGSFWYYAKQPAFRIGFWAPPDLRERVSRWTQSRSEPQFLVSDGENTRDVLADWRKRGATVEARGTVFGAEYFKISWK